MDEMEAMIARRKPGYVIAAPVHALMVARDDPEMRAAVDNAALVVPDGMPVVWAANRLGAKMKGRVYGPELMLRFCERSARAGFRVWLYGGHDQDGVTQLAQSLRSRFPGLKIVGSYSPPHRPLTSEEEDALVRLINRSKPDIVWVGIGVPKQEKWMFKMRPLLEAPVLVGVGAAFDFHAGLKKQAPGWMQRLGLEWLFRLTQEPRRLFKRYFTYNLRFIAAFTRQFINRKRNTK